MFQAGFNFGWIAATILLTAVSTPARALDESPGGGVTAACVDGTPSDSVGVAVAITVIDRVPIGLRPPPRVIPSPFWTALLPPYSSGPAGSELAGQPELDALWSLQTARDSLPDRMPLRTRLLWGERGLFRVVGLGPDTRAGELRLRRSMLQWHQRFGLATLGVLTTQVILGELLAKDSARYDDLRPYHRNGAYVTFSLYMTTASLSLFAPPARRYSTGFSSIKLHRSLAVIHFAGMVAQPFLGRSLARSTTSQQRDDRLRNHMWVGRVTLGAYTAAILSTFLAY